MIITKFDHSTILLEKEGEKIIFDPVEITHALPKLEGIVAIVITHRHSDHCRPEIIKRIMADNPNAKILTTNDNLANFTEFDSDPVNDGETIQIGKFKLSFFGKYHAFILPGVILCENTGVVVDDTIINPGDSFDIPPVKAPVLLVPFCAPWCKTSEVVNYINKIRPQTAIPVHDALLSDFGQGITYNVVNGACEKIGTTLKYLRPGEAMDC